MKARDVTNFFGVTQSKNTDQNLTNDPEAHLTEQEKLDRKFPKAEREVLYQWKGMSRPHLRGMNPKTMRTFIIIGVVIAVLLVAMQEFFLILVVLSLVFVAYTLSQMPPEELDFQLTNHGIQYGHTFYNWDAVRSFYLVTNDGVNAFAVNLWSEVPGRIYLTVQPANLQDIQATMRKYVTYLEEEPKTFVDRAYESVIGRINTN